MVVPATQSLRDHETARLRPGGPPRAGQAMAAGYDVVVQTLLIQQQ